MTSASKITVLGWGLTGLALLGFAARVIEKVVSGHGLDPYITGKGARFNYMGALVVLTAIASVGMIAGVRYALRNWRQRPGREEGSRNE